MKKHDFRTPNFDNYPQLADHITLEMVQNYFRVFLPITTSEDFTRSFAKSMDLWTNLEKNSSRAQKLIRSAPGWSLWAGNPSDRFIVNVLCCGGPPNSTRARRYTIFHQNSTQNLGFPDFQPGSEGRPCR